MDKLKYIRIREGISSNDIPIGADASNIDLSNGKNLQSTLGDYDYTKSGNINNKINALDNTTKNLTTTVATKANQTDLNNLTTVVNTKANQAALSDLTVEVSTKASKNQVAALKSLVGSPLIATSTAQMTDTSKIYVYTGNQSGYINGNWYYYDGDMWISGGVYNAVAIATDTTLSISGAAADAAVTGTELADLKSAIGQINGGSINLLNPVDFQEGKYIVDGGGLAYNANLTVSGFFRVDGNATYYMYRSDTYQVRVAYYADNSESSYLSMDAAISSTIPVFTTPANAKYARLSTNKNMILDMGVYTSDIKYYIPYQFRLADSVSIENQIDSTLTDAKKAAPADIVGQIKSHVIFPENCIKYGDAGMIINERLNISDGTIATNSSGQTRTDYIPVNVGDYVQTCAIRDICLYNDKFEYLGYINLWSSNGTVVPPSTWSGNYNANITQIEAVNGISPAYIRCWGKTDAYPPAITMLSSEPYKVVNLGDSIFGNNEKPWDLGTYIQNITGLKDANCGYGGTTARVIPSGNMSPLGLPSIVDCIVSEDFSPLGTPAYWANLREYRYGVPTLLFGMIDFSEVEIITIAYGTNDWNSNTPLDNADNRLDTSTYKGGLRYAVENLQTKYPDITLIMLSPIYRYWSNASDYSTVDTDSDTRTNNLGLKLTDYVTAVEEVAEEYHLPYFDNYKGIGLNKYTAPTWLRDGTHLNRGIGVDKMGHIVAREVNRIY